MLEITNHISIPEKEIELQAIRSQGPGGQHVNKVSTAAHLRFDIKGSSLPETLKERLLNLNDHRITENGVIIIKAQQHSSLHKNRFEALSRLQNLIRGVLSTPKKRKPTRPTRRSKEKRLDQKNRRSRIKSLRKKPTRSQEF